MAKGKKTGGRNFTPGISGNPKGAPTLDPRVREVRRLTIEEFETMASTLLTASEAELQSILNDQNQPYIKRIVVQILKRAHNDGSMGTLDMLLNRVIGKVKEKIEHTVLKPAIIIRQDGSEVVFTNQPVKPEEEE